MQFAKVSVHSISSSAQTHRSAFCKPLLAPVQQLLRQNIFKLEKLIAFLCSTRTAFSPQDSKLRCYFRLQNIQS